MRHLVMDGHFRKATLITILIAVPTALALGPDSFLLMLARSFMRQWIIAFALLTALFALKRMMWMALLGLMAVFVLSVRAVDPMAAIAPQRAGQHLLRVGQFNVLQPNGKKEAMIGTARASGADVLSFQEVDDAWAKVLDTALSGDFPYRRIVPRSDCYGIALFSRLPFEALEVIDLLGAPAIQATVRCDGGQVVVTAVHARSPFPSSAFHKRNRQLEMLAERLAVMGKPQVLIGDLNTVTWDDAMLRFRGRAGLGAAPEFVQATFPNVLGMSLIPIDHILGSSQIAITNVSTAFLNGSDHRGLFADISFNVQ
ncbi:MAG: endonuclease/exonuclease/phosphatase family protein [Flavobacteriales bacterium]|nr:endonuclease/exonuclease/phosphatase family protein [Flavobacteriales bacterium]